MITLRPVDLAREHGLSTQAVRNYEDAGALPPAERTASGYRVYTPRHAAALRAYLALVTAYGYDVAHQVMHALHHPGPGEGVAQALAGIDAGHVRRERDWATLEAVRAAATHLGGAVRAEPAARHTPVRGDLTIGELAGRLGLSRATLRGWERAGILAPPRMRGTGHRVYDADQVRDAEFTQLLRRGGYRLEEIATVLRQLRGVDVGPGDLGRAALEEALGRWEERLVGQGLAMLRAAALLSDYLEHP